MDNMQQKIAAAMRLANARTEEEREAALKEVLRLLEATEPDLEDIIRGILLEIGAKDYLLGYSMAVEGIMIAMEDRKYQENIYTELYPKIAEAFDSTASRVERAIRHMIERTWLTGDMDAQHRLFGSAIDPDKGKPTNTQFILRMVYITRQRMKMG